MSEEITLDELAQATCKYYEKTMKTHIRALACHCECLSMNAENCQAMCADTKAPFGNSAYHLTMQKWGLINDEGNPII